MCSFCNRIKIEVATLRIRSHVDATLLSYATAIKHFTEAIRHDNTDHVHAQLGFALPCPDSTWNLRRSALQLLRSGSDLREGRPANWLPSWEVLST